MDFGEKKNLKRVKRGSRESAVPFFNVLFLTFFEKNC